MAKATKEERLARADRMEAYGKSIEETVLVISNKREEAIKEADRLAVVIAYHNNELEFLKENIRSLRNA